MSSLDSTSATKEVDVSRRPDYLEDQITWSRPKVGQITWARSIGGRRNVAPPFCSFGRFSPSRTRARADDDAEDEHAERERTAGEQADGRPGAAEMSNLPSHTTSAPHFWENQVICPYFLGNQVICPFFLHFTR